MKITGPIIIQLIMIGVCVLVSIACLIYDVFKWIKDKCNSEETDTLQTDDVIFKEDEKSDIDDKIKGTNSSLGNTHADVHPTDMNVTGKRLVFEGQRRKRKKHIPISS